jgi:hypothetical protein
MKRNLFLFPDAAIDTPGAGAAAAGLDDGGSSEAFDKQFSDIDAPATPAAPEAGSGGGGGGGAPPAGAAPAKPAGSPAAPAKPAGGAPAKAAAAAAPAKPAGSAPAPEFEVVDGVHVPKFKSDKEFRGWGLNGYKKASQFEKELTELRTKYGQLETEHPKTQAEKTQLATRLAQVEKAIAEKESVIKFLNYEKSQDYQDKYQKPYQDAVRSAYSDVKELTITEVDPNGQPDADGKRPTRERAATAEDFEAIYQLPLGAATKAANERFGAAASIVLNHRAAIRKMAQSAVMALEDWKKTSKEREEKEATETTQRNDFVARTWEKVNTDLATKYPDQFAEVKDDVDGNAALQKGFNLADDFFNNRSRRTLEQNIIFDAQVRNRLANYPRLLQQVRKAKADLEQANKDLTELRGSGPGDPQGGGDAGAGAAAAAEGESVMDRFDKKL